MGGTRTCAHIISLALSSASKHVRSGARHTHKTTEIDSHTHTHKCYHINNSCRSTSSSSRRVFVRVIETGLFISKIRAALKFLCYAQVYKRREISRAWRIKTERRRERRTRLAKNMVIRSMYSCSETLGAKVSPPSLSLGARFVSQSGRTNVGGK